MSGTWLDIPDGLIEANAPLQSRIFSRISRNSDARAYIPLTPSDRLVTGSNPTSFGTLFEQPFYLPKYLIGPGGTRLRMTFEVSLSAGPGSATATFRLKVKSTSDVSNTVDITAQPGGTDKIANFTLDWTPAAGDVFEGIEWQTRSADSSSAGEEMKWGRLGLVNDLVADENFIERLAV